ncbi:MAG TPA: hypothetical protein VEI06_15520 [Gemmatimonadaceae bacterium]|nr:hypothetical protein [Gemmatimonadaceae bacterium]
MPRALVLQRSIVPLNDRKKYMEKLRARRSYFAGANCKFWVFEEGDLPGAFMEFIEAPDAATLSRALEGASETVVDAARIYQEVELT